MEKAEWKSHIKDQLKEILRYRPEAVFADNAMFSLKEGVDKAVTVHIWMEGTDEACTDELRGSDYSIRLRFTGDKTDDQNK